MKFITLLLTITSAYCYSQSNYKELLSTRIEEIKHQQLFDNSVVVYDESSCYGSNLTVWKPEENYYQGDLVMEKGKSCELYEAVASSKGKKPSASSSEWVLISQTHPYFFLRDTVHVNDLRKLLISDNSHVRIYAFAALAHRNDNGLFEFIINSLSDTTRIEQLTGDVGSEVYPADLMIWSMLNKLKKKEIKMLLKLIDTKYKDFVVGRRLLTER